MTNKIAKKEKTNKPQEVSSTDDAKSLAIIVAQKDYDSDRLAKQLSTDLQLMEATENNGSKIAEKVADDLDTLSIALGLESGYVLMESIMERYRPLALQMKKELEKEFSCKTASEKALVNQAVNAHIRGMSYSGLMEQSNNPEWLSNEKVAMLNFYSREVDRAHRQYVSAIETIKFMKQPALRVNVKTNNAFIAQNQQFNNNQKSKDENNEAE